MNSILHPPSSIRVGDLVSYIAPWSLGPTRCGKPEPARVTAVHACTDCIDLITADGHRFGPVPHISNSHNGIETTENTWGFEEISDPKNLAPPPNDGSAQA
jgi:hypothetical protein